MAAYALARKDADARRLSASGGVFSVFAEHILAQNGVAFGAALKREASTLLPCHCMASSLEELAPLRGSKYVQSDLGNTFAQARQLLEVGKKVLFSDTPCQIAALKAYLRRDYDSLLTIDLVCHGVPNAQMFRDYLKILEKKVGGSIETFHFRVKNNDWGKDGQGLFVDATGNRIVQAVPRYESSYYDYFFQNLILRDSCHNCNYAGKQHLADLTVSDFWGFAEMHPEAVAPGEGFDPNAGISALIVNTEKGAKFFSQCVNEFYWIPSTFEKVSKHNPQLLYPCKPGAEREKILALYSNKGFGAVDIHYWRQKKKVAFINWVKYRVHHDIPEPIRTIGRKMLRR